MCFLLWCVYRTYVGAPFCVALLFLSCVLCFVVAVFAGGVFTRILACQARLLALFVFVACVPC